MKRPEHEIINTPKYDAAGFEITSPESRLITLHRTDWRLPNYRLKPLEASDVTPSKTNEIEEIGEYRLKFTRLRDTQNSIVVDSEETFTQHDLLLTISGASQAISIFNIGLTPILRPVIDALEKANNFAEETIRNL